MCTDLYQQACEVLATNGLKQYEISNFARIGAESLHNRKYWERAPYVGLGLDAHSMLFDGHSAAVRFQNADDLESYLVADGPSETLRVSDEQALEEAVFLGLRLASGIYLNELAGKYKPTLLHPVVERARELAADGLMIVTNERIALTAKGRVLSSAIFGELLAVAA